MVEADKQARAPVAALFSSGQEPDSATSAAVVARVLQTDSVNLVRLKEIVREHGWPDRRAVGDEAVAAVFLLVQHADREVAFQKEYLVWLEEGFRAGELEVGAGHWLALLTDRVRTNEGQPQLYGTQVYIERGKVSIHPLEDEPNVDRRRAELGLPPLADYIAQLKQFYGIQ